MNRKDLLAQEGTGGHGLGECRVFKTALTKQVGIFQSFFFLKDIFSVLFLRHCTNLETCISGSSRSQRKV